jgi:hypothetical protein
LRQFEDGDGFDILFSFKIYMLLQPNQVCRLSQQQQNNRRSSYQNFFLWDFSLLSAKLHLETGLAFNTTRYSLRSFAAAETVQNWPIPLGKCGREQDFPIASLKPKRYMRPLVKGFQHNIAER